MGQYASKWAKYVDTAGPPLRGFTADLAGLPFNLVVNVIGRSALVPRLTRTVLLRLVGLEVAWGASVAEGVRIRGRLLAVGGGSTLNQDVQIDCSAQVSIGRDCGIGYGVRLITGNHFFNDPAVRAGREFYEPISVGNGVWIGSGAIILPGVTIGDGAVIAAGAVVNRDCDSHALYGGIPARRLRKLEEKLPTHDV